MARFLMVVLVLMVALTVGAVPAGASRGSNHDRLHPRTGRTWAGWPTSTATVTHTDAAVGAPTEDVDAIADAGAISIFYGFATATGLPIFSQTLGQGDPEAGDHFGAALAVGNFNGDHFDDPVVGAPGEDVGAAVDAGAANFFSFGTTGVLPSVSGPALLQDNPEPGDHFGAALTSEAVDEPRDDLVVGAPGEDVGAKVDAGAANLFHNSAVVQGSVSGPALLQDHPEGGDHFGATLTAKFLGGDDRFDVVVAAPGEDVGATVDAGAANVLSTTSGMLPSVSNQTLLQNNPEPGDQFSAALDV